MCSAQGIDEGIDVPLLTPDWMTDVCEALIEEADDLEELLDQ